MITSFFTSNSGYILRQFHILLEIWYVLLKKKNWIRNAPLARMYWGWQLRSMEKPRQPLASGHSWVQREDLKLGPRHVCRCPCRLVLPIHPWFTSSFPREDILQSKVLSCSSPPFTFFPPTRGGPPPCCLWSLSFPRTQWHGFNLYSLSHFLSTSASSIEIDPVFSPHLQISSNPTSIPSSFVLCYPFRVSQSNFFLQDLAILFYNFFFLMV